MCKQKLKQNTLVGMELKSQLKQIIVHVFFKKAVDYLYS
jgi:hypothetical protein